MKLPCFLARCEVSSELEWGVSPLQLPPKKNPNVLLLLTEKERDRCFTTTRERAGRQTANASNLVSKQVNNLREGMQTNTCDFVEYNTSVWSVSLRTDYNNFWEKERYPFGGISTSTFWLIRVTHSCPMRLQKAWFFIMEIKICDVMCLSGWYHECIEGCNGLLAMPPIT